MALGDSSSASSANAIAFGANAQRPFANSVAIGPGAMTTAANEFMFGTTTNIYTMPGVTSAASLAAQSGDVSIVTADADGHLAVSDFTIPADATFCDEPVAGSFECGTGATAGSTAPRSGRTPRPRWKHRLRQRRQRRGHWQRQHRDRPLCRHASGDNAFNTAWGSRLQCQR